MLVETEAQITILIQDGNVFHMLFFHFSQAIFPFFTIISDYFAVYIISSMSQCIFLTSKSNMVIYGIVHKDDMLEDK